MSTTPTLHPTGTEPMDLTPDGDPTGTTTCHFCRSTVDVWATEHDCRPQGEEPTHTAGGRPATA